MSQRVEVNTDPSNHTLVDFNYTTSESTLQSVAPAAAADNESSVIFNQSLRLFTRLVSDARDLEVPTHPIVLGGIGLLCLGTLILGLCTYRYKSLAVEKIPPEGEVVECESAVDEFKVQIVPEEERLMISRGKELLEYEPAVEAQIVPEGEGLNRKLIKEPNRRFISRPINNLITNSVEQPGSTERPMSLGESLRLEIMEKARIEGLPPSEHSAFFTKETVEE